MNKIQNKFMAASKNLIKTGLAFIVFAIGMVTLLASGAALTGAI